MDMLPATVARLSQLPGIVAFKEAVTEPGRVRALVEACRKDFVVLSGDDATARRSFQEGSRGVISVTANVAPRGMADMGRGGDARDHASARKTRRAAGGAASGSVYRGESDSEQMGAGAHGLDRGRHPVAADSHCPLRRSQWVLKALQGAGILPGELSWRAHACRIDESKSVRYSRRPNDDRRGCAP